MRPHMRYAMVGVLLGFGAPLGSLLCQILIHPGVNFLSTFSLEWQTANFYYVYMAVGTVIAFSLFGYALGQRNETLNNLSNTDGLTGVFNHRYLHEQLAREIHRSDRYAAPLTCLMLDIDDFKLVNDNHGHPFGDDVLIKVTQLLRQAVRQTDVVGRYGGEEFLIIMPQTDGAAAWPLANRILKAVACYPFAAEGKPIRVTLSIGLATYPLPDRGVKTKNSLLSAADQALYKAKRTGKNKTIIWAP